MTPEELDKKLLAGVGPFIIDVRSDLEFRQGHLPGALNIPFWKLATLKRATLDAGQRPVIFCCEHGPRAWLAGWLLKLVAQIKVDFLQGHMSAWKRSGRKLVQD